MDSANALEQINAYLDGKNLDASKYAVQFKERSKRYKAWRETLRSQESPSPDGVLKLPYFLSQLRERLPDNFSIVLEAVTNAATVIHHLNLTKVCYSRPADSSIAHS